MLIVDIAESEYIVFEHGPFNYDQENRSIESKLETAMSSFDFNDTDVCYDITSERIIYSYYNPQHCIKYVRPIK